MTTAELAEQEAQRQKEQLDRYLAWVRAEGGEEGPVRLSTYMKAHQRTRIRWLQQHSEGSILEVGCNWGYVLACLGGGTGIDKNPQVLALARLLAPQSMFLQIDLTHDGFLSLATGSFDTVLLSEVLEHLPWDFVQRIVSDARRVARKRVLMTVPDGTEDTEDATNLKHAWLATSDRVRKLLDYAGSPVVLYRDGSFIYIQRDI